MGPGAAVVGEDASTEPDKRATAQDVLESSEHELISAQVLNEFWVTVTRQLSRALDEDAAADVVADLSTAFEVVPIDAMLSLAGVARARADQLSLWDALVFESASTAGCDVVLTEDLNDGRSYGGVVIQDPFASNG